MADLDPGQRLLNRGFFPRVTQSGNSRIRGLLDACRALQQATSGQGDCGKHSALTSIISAVVNFGRIGRRSGSGACTFDS